MKTQKIATAFLSCIFILQASVLAFGQQISVRYNLPNESVTDLVQDAQGYLWISTEHGLCRYDGSTYLTYVAGGDSLSLINDAVRSICTDGQNCLWYANECGIGYWDGSRFIQPDNYTYDRVRHISAIGNARILFATRFGIHVIDRNTFLPLATYTHPDIVLPVVTYCPSSQEIWACRNVQTDSDIAIFDSCLNLLHTIPSDKVVSSMFTDNQGAILWTFGREGLASYDIYRHQNIPLPSQLQDLERDTAHPILFVNRFGRRDLLLGIYNKGIFRYDTSANRLVAIDNTIKLQTEQPYTTLVDRDLNVWIYSQGNGLKLICHPKNYTSHVNEFVAYKQYNFHNLSSDKEGYIWFHTPNELISYQPGISSISDVNHGVYFISLIDSHNNLWSVQSDHQLTEYSLSEGQASPIRSYSIDEYPHSLAEDRDGNLWLAYAKRCLIVSPQGKLSQMMLPDSLNCTQLIASPGTRNLYLVTREGLFRVINHMTNHEYQKLPLPIKHPTCVLDYNDSTLYVGSLNQGLFRYQPGIEKIEQWQTTNGLFDNNVKQLICDAHGNIWIESPASITCFDVTQQHFSYVNDPNLTTGIGYQGGCLTKDGLLCFGAKGGITTIDVQQFYQELSKPTRIPLSLDMLTINGVIRNDLLKNGIIDLSHDENDITLSFSGLDLISGNCLKYMYQLEGCDSGWKYIQGSSHVAYSHLPAGHYHFQVRVMGADGTWLKEGIIDLPITVHPPFWATPWALALYAILLAVILYLSFRLIVRWRLRESRLKLSERDRQITREHINFLTNISHEFRTPLTLIYGPLQQLCNTENPPSGGQQQQLISFMNRNVKRLLHLTEQILSSGRKPEEKPLQVALSSLSSLVKAQCDTFRFVAADKGLEIETSIDAKMPDVWFDLDKVEKILYNLISNAIKYTPSGAGTILVKVFQTTVNGVEWANVSVSDCGIGVPENKREKLFNRFERLDINKIMPEITGTGVGLNYSSQLALLHHGHLSYNPVEPHGSDFTFSIPAQRDQYAEDEISNVSEMAETRAVDEDSFSRDETEQPEDDKPTILIAEDNHDVLQYIRQLLISDYHVIPAEDGVKAWNRLRSGLLPDLVLSDVIMPRKDGFTLCKDIKSDESLCNLPVILLTAKSDLDNRIKGLDCGADAYISKPFDPYLLRHQIHNLIESRRKLQQQLIAVP